MHAPLDAPSLRAGRRRLVTVGVAGAALALSAVGGVPALADSHGSHGSQGQSATHRSGGHGASESGSASSTKGSSTKGSSADGSTANGPDGHNPPGNNGTVFIHDVAGDQSPHNVPHVSCNFYVDFFGFDAGQSVTVSFAGQAPTGPGTALGGTWTGVVSTDDASGAGNDFDDELAFTADQLGVSSLGAPAHQGYHVKMTVATNEPGGKKSKVFWIEPCTTPPAVLGGGTTGGGTTSGGGVLGGGTLNGGGAVAGGATGGASVGAAGATTGGARVLGESFTRGAAGTAAGGATGLPFTGAEIGLMTAAGLALLGGGTALTVAARRRRGQRRLTAV